MFRGVCFVIVDEEMSTADGQERSAFSGLLDDDHEKDTNEILSDTATAYSEYLNLDIRKEKAEFTENVDELLTRLDEFCGLVDVIRSDTNLCLNKTMPAIHAKSQQMKEVFDKIDRLDAFVKMVGKTVTEMESQLNKAESDLATSNSFMKILSVPFFSKKSAPKTPARSTADNPFSPLHIFHTDDYIQYDHAELSSGLIKSKSDNLSPSSSLSQPEKPKSAEKSIPTSTSQAASKES